MRKGINLIISKVAIKPPIIPEICPDKEIEGTNIEISSINRTLDWKWC